MADIITAQPKQSGWRMFLKGLGMAAFGAASQAAITAVTGGNLNPKDIGRAAGITALVAVLAYVKDFAPKTQITAAEAKDIEMVNAKEAVDNIFITREAAKKDEPKS